MASATAAADPFLSEVAGHLVSAGGKRLRPALVVRPPAVSGPDGPHVQRGGCPRAASPSSWCTSGPLYHDDVMDEAEHRPGRTERQRPMGQPGRHPGRRFPAGPGLGDRRLARHRGGGAAGPHHRPAVRGRGRASCATPSIRPGPSRRTWRSIAGKTASLMATSSRIGAIVSGAPRPWVEALTDFGQAFGMAFQIWDDIRDLVCDRRAAGQAGRPRPGRRHLHPAGDPGAGDARGRRRAAGPARRPAGRADPGQGPGPDPVDSPRCCPRRATPATGPSGQTGPSTPCAPTRWGPGGRARGAGPGWPPPDRRARSSLNAAIRRAVPAGRGQVDRAASRCPTWLCERCVNSGAAAVRSAPGAGSGRQ